VSCKGNCQKFLSSLVQGEQTCSSSRKKDVSMVAIVTGSAGLVGSETARFLAGKGMDVIGIDNDMRAQFFGVDASTLWSRNLLEREVPGYHHEDVDIRDIGAMRRIFTAHGSAIRLVVHTAAQPSHDWAANDPFTDFSVNATGTLNLLQMTREHCPDAVFIFVSTNKVYGDRPNTLPLVEMDTRWEVCADHPFAQKGIDETMSVDGCLHSLFGASKLAADVFVQEYGRYFGMKTACFRGGCLTGPGHSSVPLHGFLAYLVRCAYEDREYLINGYKGKQVRDNIHSSDLVQAFWAFFQNPSEGKIYNIGGGRGNDVSIIEAIKIVEEISGKPFLYKYQETNRIGDHIWYVSDLTRFRKDYPEWSQKYTINETMHEIYEGYAERSHA
jgi:CDP-paratose 2-epimerase